MEGAVAKAKAQHQHPQPSGGRTVVYARPQAAPTPLRRDPPTLAGRQCRTIPRHSPGGRRFHTPPLRPSPRPKRPTGCHAGTRRWIAMAPTPAVELLMDQNTPIPGRKRLIRLTISRAAGASLCANRAMPRGSRSGDKPLTAPGSDRDQWSRAGESSAETGTAPGRGAVPPAAAGYCAATACVGRKRHRIHGPSGRPGP